MLSIYSGHKNPAIGTSQSYLMLKERGTAEEQQQCTRESQQLLANPTYQHLQNECPLLNRLCLETLRLTAHSIGGLRIANKDLPLGDGSFIIPKGSSVALAHITSSLDGAKWKDPDTLDLDIMSGSRSKYLYDDDYAFTTFSHGVHKCPGQRLALVMLPCTFAILLAEYTIELPGDVAPSLCFERATLAQRAGPVDVTISEKKQTD